MSNDDDNVSGHLYLRLLFDPDRFGFRRVADRILMGCLDYHAFVAFKRSCRSGRQTSYVVIAEAVNYHWKSKQQ